MAITDPGKQIDAPASAAKNRQNLLDYVQNQFHSFGAIPDQGSTETSYLFFTDIGGSFDIEIQFTQGGSVEKTWFSITTTEDDGVIDAVAIYGNNTTFVTGATANDKAAILVTEGKLGINCRFDGGIQNLLIKRTGGGV
jgi:hypothetical protein